MLTKYEKIAICAIIFFLIFPFSCLRTSLVPDYSFSSCFSAYLANFLFILILKLLTGGLMIFSLFKPLMLDPILFTNYYMRGYTLLLGIILLFITYYVITNKIFQEPHKKRKILIGFILIYLILGVIAIDMGFGPY